MCDANLAELLAEEEAAVKSTRIMTKGIFQSQIAQKLPDSRHQQSLHVASHWCRESFAQISCNADEALTIVDLQADLPVIAWRLASRQLCSTYKAVGCDLWAIWHMLDHAFMYNKKAWTPTADHRNRCNVPRDTVEKAPGCCLPLSSRDGCCT